MSTEFEIRRGETADMPSLERLYRDAFPGEDLLPLVRALSGLDRGLLSLVGLRGGSLVGHVAFTSCGVEGREATVALLGPLAVASDARRQGLGRALVHEGVRELSEGSIERVLVLGDPGYYGRLGFVTETRVLPPYTLVEAWRTAWQSLPLRCSDPACAGRLLVPQPWRRPALWSP